MHADFTAISRAPVALIGGEPACIEARLNRPLARQEDIYRALYPNAC